MKVLGINLNEPIIIGFSIIFIALGTAVSLIGNLFTNYQDLIRQLGGILVVVIGLIMVGILNPEFLMKERKYQFKNKPMGYAGSVLVGITYAAGWTPCVNLFGGFRGF